MSHPGRRVFKRPTSTKKADRRKPREKEGQFTTALAGSREISIAVGLLMKRLHLACDEAFEALRSSARSGRCALPEVAPEVLESSESPNFYRKIEPAAKYGK